MILWSSSIDRTITILDFYFCQISRLHYLPNFKSVPFFPTQVVYPSCSTCCMEIACNRLLYSVQSDSCFSNVNLIMIHLYLKPLHGFPISLRIKAKVLHKITSVSWVPLHLYSSFPVLSHTGILLQLPLLSQMLFLLPAMLSDSHWFFPSQPKSYFSFPSLTRSSTLPHLTRPG